MTAVHSTALLTKASLPIWQLRDPAENSNELPALLTPPKHQLLVSRSPTDWQCSPIRSYDLQYGSFGFDASSSNDGSNA